MTRKKNDGFSTVFWNFWVLGTILAHQSVKFKLSGPGMLLEASYLWNLREFSVHLYRGPCPKKHLRLKDVPVLLLWNAAVLHTLEKVARYSQTFMRAQILLFRCHELEKKISKLNVKMNSEVICCNYLSQWWVRVRVWHDLIVYKYLVALY
jgi:hypothetical protein